MKVQPALFDSAKLFLLRSVVLRLCGHLHCRFTVTTLDQPNGCLQTKAHIHFLIAHRSNKHVDRFLGILPNVVAKFKRRGIRETSFATSSRTSTPFFFRPSPPSIDSLFNLFTLESLGLGQGTS